MGVPIYREHGVSGVLVCPDQVVMADPLIMGVIWNTK